MNIIGVSGSLRNGSYTKQMVETVLKQCKKEGANTELIDLAQYKHLPYCDGEGGYSKSEFEDIKALQKKLDEADGLIIGTPEYHGGYSGVLKNFLDLMSGDQFKGKLIGLVGAAGGRNGADGALNQLRVVFKNLHAVCFPSQTSAGGTDIENNQLTSGLTNRLEDMSKKYCELLQQLNK